MRGPPGFVRRVLRPEYLLRPAQVLRRLVRPATGMRRVRLPWGLELEVRADEVIGRALLTLGVYDLALTEALWRLAQPDDVAVDGGANVGYASAVLAARAGRVVAFEPHPGLVRRLEANAARWSGRAAPVDVRRAALDAREIMARLVEGPDFAANEGVARLTSDPGIGGVAFDVEATTLDRVFAGTAIGVLKLDVEGHEAEVLAGAAQLLARRAIRDIVYEDHASYPSAVSRRLADAGYRLFALGRTFRGPSLDPPGHRPGGGREPPNYLATLDADRASRLFAPRGWTSLSTGDITARPALLRLLPDRLREAAYHRHYLPLRARWRGLYVAAPLAYAPGTTMELVPTDVAHGCIALAGFVELRLTRYVARLAREGGVLVDVGANAGYYSLQWASTRRDNQVVAFEPSERNVTLLRRNIERNRLGERVVVHPVALGRAAGVMGFEPGPDGQTGWGGLSPSPTGTIVEVRRLDELLPTALPVALLKVDTEGADAWVLMGCERLLAAGSIQRVVFEENVPRMTALGIAPGTSAAILERHGYVVAPIGRARGPLTEWEAHRPGQLPAEAQIR